MRIKIDRDNTTDSFGRKVGYVSSDTRRGWFFRSDGSVGDALRTLEEDQEPSTVAEYPRLLGLTTAQKAIRRMFAK